MPTTNPEVHSSRAALGMCLSLAIATLAVYWPVAGFGFINFDDPLYVTANHRVGQGLTWQGISWAFQTGHAANWHPLTWLSHMLDVQFFGMNAGRHHLVNLLFHLANTLLLFGLFRKMTGALWRSAFVAALFALHPLHVESVAWVSERKEVFSTFFGLLCLLCYLRWVKEKGVRSQWRGSAGLLYVLAVGLFALSLMGKPMLVTLPFLLLLLDFWPLRRFQLPFQQPTNPSTHHSTTPLLLLVVEKLPFFALAAASSTITFLVQKHGDTVLSIDSLPIGTRLGNASTAYLHYVEKFFWPTGLALPYPYLEISRAETALATFLLVAASAVTLLLARTRLYLATGWFWFLGTLVPVIGLIQVGPQAMADRYTYIPLIGLSVAITWLVADWLQSLPYGRILLWTAGPAVLLACAVLTRVQVGYWKNSETLFRHSVSVTVGNYLAHDNLGAALADQGQLNEAQNEFASALKIKPSFAHPLSGMGGICWSRGEFGAAAGWFSRAVELSPRSAEARQNLASALAAQGKLDEAIAMFQEALRLQPDYEAARANLSAALAQRQHWTDASSHYDAGAVLLKQQRPKDAIEEFRKALALRPEWPEVLNNLAWLLATHPSPEVRNGTQAVQLAEHACQATGRTNLWMVSTLAAAYAEAGRTADAVAAQNQVCELATLQLGSAELAPFLGRLDLYRSGGAYHQPSQ